MRFRYAALAVAVVAFALFLILGKVVGREPDPGWLFFVEMSWVNHSTLIAWWFTWFGFFAVLLPLCLALIVVAVFAPEWRWRVGASIVCVLLAWQGADVFQRFFDRPRRLDWVVQHVTAPTYPSSHAAVATAFYLLWSVLIARSSLPYRTVASLLLALLGFCIMWSRLALGAHYLTDVLGGALWGVTVVAFITAILPINIFQGRSGASLE